MTPPITSPLGGTRDFLPDDVLRRAYVTEIIERVYQQYGFQPLETPAVERLSTLLGKYGDEGDQLVYRLLRRGAALQEALSDEPTEGSLSEEGLRYDLTVPLARVVAEYRQQLPPIFKRYQIQPVYRGDRPAKGRFREFYQCDVDIVGTTSTLAEVEVLSAAVQVLQELGFTGPDAFTVRLNHRGLLRAVIEVAGVPSNLEVPAIVALDKLDKIGPEGVTSELLERGIPAGATSRLMDLLSGQVGGNDERLDHLGVALAGTQGGREAVDDLRRLLSYAGATPAAAHIAIDPSLARGLSYYTGPIFEIAVPGMSGSIGAGGRYDNLLGMFAGRDIPACGISLGFERIVVVMAERGMFPEQLAGRAQALVTVRTEVLAGECLRLAAELRQAGLRIDLYPEPKGYGPQFKYATGRHIPFALLLGERELESGVVAIRDLRSGQQSDVPRQEVGIWLQAHLGVERFPPDTSRSEGHDGT